MSVWEFAIPEGTPLPHCAPVPVDPEKARLRALTTALEDQGEDYPTEIAA